MSFNTKSAHIPWTWEAAHVYEHCHVWGTLEPPFPCEMLSIWFRKGWGWMIITHLILGGRRKGHGFISGLTYFSLNLFWKQRKDGKQSGTLFPADSAEEAQWHRFSFQGGHEARWSLAGFCVSGILAPTAHWLLRLHLISKDLVSTCRLLGRPSSYLILLQWILKISKDFFCAPWTGWCILITLLWTIDFFFSKGS